MITDLSQIFMAEKHLPSEPDWKSRVNDEWMRLTCPIDIRGVTIEGLRLGISANRQMPDRAVSFQIEYLPSRRSGLGGAMCRIEWRPLKPHNNKGIGPPEYRHMWIRCCHHHPFDLNWQHSPAEVRRGRLPIAIPIEDDLAVFKDALDFVRKQFRIKDLTCVPVPPWETRLI